MELGVDLIFFYICFALEQKIFSDTHIFSDTLTLMELRVNFIFFYICFALKKYFQIHTYFQIH